jgi:class 3 adenylate cyclase
MSRTRRLAAILVVDMVGYSHLTERDEAGTLVVPKTLTGLQFHRLLR